MKDNRDSHAKNKHMVRLAKQIPMIYKGVFMDLPTWKQAKNGDILRNLCSSFAFMCEVVLPQNTSITFQSFLEMICMITANSEKLAELQSFLESC